MADSKISALSAVSSISGTEEIAVNQSGSKKATVAQILTNDAHAGYSDYSGIATPATPGAGILRAWGRNLCGRMFPAAMGPAGVPWEVQPSFFGNQILVWGPATSTTAGVSVGGSLTAAGTVSHPTPTSTGRSTARTWWILPPARICRATRRSSRLRLR